MLILTNKKTPAYAVLTTFLNLFEKWAPYCRLRLFASRYHGIMANMHAADKERPPVPRCWLKKRMLITHIAGDNIYFIPSIKLIKLSVLLSS